MRRRLRECNVVGLAAVLLVACTTPTAAETTTDRFRSVFDELQATPVSCPEDLDRFGVADEAICVAATATFRQVRRAFRREFDQGSRMLDNWTREGGYRTRIVPGDSEVFSVAHHARAGILAVVPYRPCPIDPSVHSARGEDYVPPRVLERAQPEFPTQALAAKRGGTAILRALIRADGSVGEVCLVGEYPPGYGFGDAAVQAARRTRFEPALVGGAAVPAYSIQYMRWTINPP